MLFKIVIFAVDDFIVVLLQTHIHTLLQSLLFSLSPRSIYPYPLQCVHFVGFSRFGLPFWLYSLATQALTSFRWWLMKNDRNLCWCFACLYLHVYALFKFFALAFRLAFAFAFAFAVVCRILCNRRFVVFVIVSSLLLNSFPSFIIFRFCSLLRVDLSSCYLFYPLFYFSNVEYSYAPERNSRSPLFLFLLLLLFVLLCKFTFYAMALFCRV